MAHEQPAGPARGGRSMARTGKAKCARTRRLMDKRAPQLVEDVKTAMFLRTSTCSQRMLQVLQDLYALKKPNAVFYHKKNALRPFEDASSLAFLSQKADTALFAVGYDTKKRPDTLVLGRTFDHQVLDMLECHVTNYQSMAALRSPGCSVDKKPCFVFQGSAFEQDASMASFKSLLVDFFDGQHVTGDKVYLNGLEHVVVLTAGAGGIVHFRTYHVLLKRSASHLPRVELQPMGPHMDLRIGRTQWAPEALRREALKQPPPQSSQPKKVKNVRRDALGDAYGRVHNPRQDLALLQTRKVKALRDAPPQDRAARDTKRRRVRDDAP